MKTYTIKELSTLFDLPASTLRYYEEVGLLTNIQRDGKHRIYEECHFNRLKALCCFKETGMSIAQLLTFFSYEEDADKNEEMVVLLTEHTAKVANQITRLQENMQHVQRKLNFYQDICQAEKLQQPVPSWDNYKNRSY
ncbi:MerR family transcriptional regulator [Enterococcus sp. LJL128]|uniref:MerR family transcriptional regulator n=1 Tax=Enterococcus sp. LJL51 TaxID=3416656 RepID=UPI003CE84775